MRSAVKGSDKQLTTVERQGARIAMAVSGDVATDRRVLRHVAALREAGHEVVLGEGRRMGVRHGRGWRFYAGVNRAIGRWASAQGADIVWANDVDTLPGCWLAARRSGARLVLDAHELMSEVPEIQHKPLVRWVWRTVERTLMPRCDASMTVCRSIAEHYRRQCGVEMEVVRNIAERKTENGKRKTENGEHSATQPLRHSATQPLSHSATRPLSHPATRPLGHSATRPLSHSATQPLSTLLYQGKVNVGRGVDWAIDALEWLPQCRLVVAGDGDLLEQMRAYAAAKPWAARVEFLGMVPPTELECLTPTADVGLVMLEDMGLSYHYALPNRIGDFVAAGVPMVVSDLPEMAAVVRRFDVGEVMESEECGVRSAELLARAVARVLARGKAGYDFAAARADMDWDKEKRRLLAVVERVKVER